MPICSVMWSQVPALINNTLSAMVFTLECFCDSGVFRVMATMRAVLLRLSASRVTMVRFPTRSSDGANTCQLLLLSRLTDGDIHLHLQHRCCLFMAGFSYLLCCHFQKCDG
uniref:Uncharacterized protein n=1 Tax=Mola mola TaxID=94237 RepID=A0A3Q3WAF0_MOLML